MAAWGGGHQAGRCHPKCALGLWGGSPSQEKSGGRDGVLVGRGTKDGDRTLDPYKHGISYLHIMTPINLEV